MAGTTARTHITGVHTVGVPVSDQDRALAFYRDVLGLVPTRDAPFGPGLRWLEVTPAGAATSIALLPPQGGAAGVDTGIRLTTTDVESDHEELRGAGVDVDDILRFGPGVPPMFTLRDPDGNVLYVVEQEQG